MKEQVLQDTQKAQIIQALQIAKEKKGEDIFKKENSSQLKSLLEDLLPDTEMLGVRDWLIKLVECDAYFNLKQELEIGNIKRESYRLVSVLHTSRRADIKFAKEIVGIISALITDEEIFACNEEIEIKSGSYIPSNYASTTGESEFSYSELSKNNNKGDKVSWGISIVVALSLASIMGLVGFLIGKNFPEFFSEKVKMIPENRYDFITDSDENNNSELLSVQQSDNNHSEIDIKRSDDYQQAQLLQSELMIGDIIIFGQYDWRVLDIDNDNNALIITEFTLGESMRWHNGEQDVTWENCDIRSYLNGEFYDKFSEEEKLRIVDTQLLNNDNPWYGTVGGNTTIDKVFLLSLDDIVKYFGDSGELKNNIRRDYFGMLQSDGHCIYDQFNSSRVAELPITVINLTPEYSGAHWWLRSPGYKSKTATSITPDGSIEVYGANFNFSREVRPALWLKLDT